MTTNYTIVTVSLKGQDEFLKDALVSACHYYSKSTVKNGVATLTYISETVSKDQAIAEVQDSISIDQLENLGVELAGIF